MIAEINTGLRFIEQAALASLAPILVGGGMVFAFHEVGHGGRIHLVAEHHRHRPVQHGRRRHPPASGRDALGEP